MQVQIFLPTLVDENRKIRRCGAAIAQQENFDSIKFILRSIADLAPLWLDHFRHPTIVSDAKTSPDCARQALPSSNLHYCTWHMIERDVCKQLGKQSQFAAIKKDVYDLKNATSEDEFEARWSLLKSSWPGKVVEYMKYWYDRRQCWARAWTFKHVTLGYEVGSPVESSNSSLKSQILKDSDTSLFSLLKTT